MTLAETYEPGRYRFDAPVPIDHSGAFGYTVRVLPRNPSLSSVAELGLVALPAVPDVAVTPTAR
jgi:starch phosphorylase